MVAEAKYPIVLVVHSRGFHQPDYPNEEAEITGMFAPLVTQNISR